MHIVFFSTTDVFKAEEILNTNEIVCKVVPTPVLDKAYCGVCLETCDNNAKNYIENIEHEILD